MSTGQATAPGQGSPAAPLEPLRCPRCDAALRHDQDWCLECGAPARTRLAPPPDWRLPAVAVVTMVVLATAAFAFAFVRLTDDGGGPAPSSTVTAPPAQPAPTPGQAPAPPPQQAPPAQPERDLSPGPDDAVPVP